MSSRLPLYVQLGPGIRLVRDTVLHEDCRHDGLTLEGFRSLLAAVGCPTLIVGDTRYIDPVTFQICMKAVTMACSPDFFVPTAEHPKPPHGNCRSFIPAHEIRNRWRHVVGELMAQESLAKVRTRANRSRTYKEAVERLTTLSVATIPHLVMDSMRTTKLPPFRQEGAKDGERKEGDGARQVA